jgi:hypothetical protein
MVSGAFMVAPIYPQRSREAAIPPHLNRSAAKEIISEIMSGAAPPVYPCEDLYPTVAEKVYKQGRGEKPISTKKKKSGFMNRVVSSIRSRINSDCDTTEILEKSRHDR